MLWQKVYSLAMAFCIAAWPKGVKIEPLITEIYSTVDTDTWLCPHLEAKHKDSHPQVLINSIASRVALFKGMKVMGVLDKRAHFKEFEIENHLLVKEHPSILASLAHTDGIGVAHLGWAREFSSLGVDIEKADRTIKDGAKKFFLEGACQSLSPIENWCAKEACFKAISPYIQNYMTKTFVLNDIVLENGSFRLSIINDSMGVYQIIQKDGFIIATAQMRKDLDFS